MDPRHRNEKAVFRQKSGTTNCTTRYLFMQAPVITSSQTCAARHGLFMSAARKVFAICNEGRD